MTHSDPYHDPTTWRLATNGGIPFRYLERSGSFGKEEAQVSETVLIPANRLGELAFEMFPTPTVFGTSVIYPGTGHINGTNLRAQSMKWKAHFDGLPVDPFNSDPSAPEHTYQPNVAVTIEYSTDVQQEQSESDPNDPFTFLEISANAAGEFIHSTAPKAGWTENSASSGTSTTKNKLQTTPVTLIVPETDWNVSWPRVPHVFLKDTLITKLRDRLGKVNESKMPIFFDAPEETILFVGYSIRQQFTWRTGVQPPFKFDLKFLEKHVEDDGEIRGHNHVWKPDLGKWQHLRVDGGTRTVYQTADLNKIFKP
jgi:hypothetical protein